jgi:hypothetical protein
MFRDALTFPRHGPKWLTSLGIGSALTLFGAFLFVPLIPVQGYLLRVLRTAVAGDPHPPTFDRWGDLFVDGFRMIFVQVVYAFVPVLLTFAGLSVAGFGAFEPGLAGTGLGSGIEALGWLLLALGAVSLVAVVYLVPAALARLAMTDRLASVFAVREILAAGRQPIYVVAVIQGYTVLVVLGAVGSVLSLILVGVLLVFYSQVVGYRLFGVGYAETDPAV